MAFIVDRKFDRVVELLNKMAATNEEFEQRANRLENQKISYNAENDPAYRSGQRKRHAQAVLDEQVIRGNDSESTRGYDNSWNETEVKQHWEDQQEQERAIQLQMRQDKIDAFNQDKQERLVKLKNRFASERYQEVLDINRAVEDYKFAFDKNYRRQLERLRRKNA